MKVVYFGSDVFLSCFEYFVEKHQVLALYTYHNDEDYFTEYAIVKRAGELGIPVHYEAISPEVLHGGGLRAVFHRGVRPHPDAAGGASRVPRHQHPQLAAPAGAQLLPHRGSHGAGAVMHRRDDAQGSAAIGQRRRSGAAYH